MLRIVDLVFGGAVGVEFGLDCTTRPARRKSGVAVPLTRTLVVGCR